MATLNPEAAVSGRYAAGARAAEARLSCRVDYDADLLKIIPAEVIERDYDRGDPSPFLGEGETVLDLGIGSGKICFIAAQIVGSAGKVTGATRFATNLTVFTRKRPTVSSSNLSIRLTRFRRLRRDRSSLRVARADIPGKQKSGLHRHDASKQLLQWWRRP
jgi:arsenite methyltransferase